MHKNEFCEGFQVNIKSLWLWVSLTRFCLSQLRLILLPQTKFKPLGFLLLFIYAFLRWLRSSYRLAGIFSARPKSPTTAV